MWNLQIINGQKYAKNYELKITRTVKENNTRGIIYDCNGEVLAYNELVYTVTMIDNGNYSSRREWQLALNSMIYHVVKKLEKNKEQINNELKIKIGADRKREEIKRVIRTENALEYTDSICLEHLQEYTKLFYLDRKSGIEIAESEPHVSDAYGIPSAIGQGTHNYSTVQLARYVSAIASKGDVFSLSLIKGITDTKGKISLNKSTLENKIKLPDSVWDTVHSGMLQFAENNDVLKDMEISVAGKTGTAQEAKNRPDHALFIGYAPTEQPEIAIAIRIANGYGSSNATAVGKSIFNYYFDLENQEKIITGEASQAFNTRTD